MHPMDPYQSSQVWLSTVGLKKKKQKQKQKHWHLGLNPRGAHLIGLSPEFYSSTRQGLEFA